MRERGRWTVQRLELHPPGMGLRERARTEHLRLHVAAHWDSGGGYASLTLFRRQWTVMRRSK